jgi:hypothetical protein
MFALHLAFVNEFKLKISSHFTHRDPSNGVKRYMQAYRLYQVNICRMTISAVAKGPKISRAPKIVTKMTPPQNLTPESES